ncbi:MAG: putative DNA-binding domain-containing protein [Gammaproteobacteria bacterium]|nr:putative DNA-binding domain-containing protein [Gammaproteobacteria bacterium]
MTLSLHQTQVVFLRSILNNEPVEDIESPVLLNENTHNPYQVLIFSRLIKILKRIYPVSCAYVGDELFSLLSQQFIIQFPPKLPTILAYGHYFDEFLWINRFDTYHLFLPDLARLEWAWYTSFHGSYQPPYSFEKLLLLINQTQEKTRLSIPRSAHLLRLHYPVYDAWQSHQKDESLPILSPQWNFLMLWREEEKIKIEKLQQEEFLILKLIETNHTLEEVCYFYQTFSTHIALDDLFSSLCQRGCIVPFKHEGNENIV